jgi:hypothetical protein
MPVSEATLKPLRGTHSIFSRIFDGEHIFVVLPNGEEPSESGGGYYSIEAALSAKGM